MSDETIAAGEDDGEVTADDFVVTDETVDSTQGGIEKFVSDEAPDHDPFADYEV